MTGRPDDIGSMTGAYALDALDDSERLALDDAMANSTELRVELDSLRETALALAYATEPVTPSADLRSALLAKIATTPQMAAPAVAGPVTDDAPASEARHAAVTNLTTGGGRAAAAARQKWFHRPAAVLSVAAAAVVLFVGAAVGVTSYVNPTSGPSSVQAASGLDQIYAASDFARQSSDVRGGGTATVVWSDQLGRSAVILDGVKAPPTGKTYELWYIGGDSRGGEIVSAGLVNGVDGGVRSAVLSGPQPPGDTVGVTVEPTGGSKQPTSDPVMTVATSRA